MPFGSQKLGILSYHLMKPLWNIPSTPDRQLEPTRDSVAWEGLAPDGPSRHAPQAPASARKRRLPFACWEL